MTREEAIERLKTDIYKYADFTENPNENEFWMAFDMSIKALQQEPKTGRWIKIEPYPMMEHEYKCSECYNGTDNPFEKYCSECGTKMEVKE